MCRKISVREKRVISSLNVKLNLHVLQLSLSEISWYWVTNGFCTFVIIFEDHRFQRFPYQNERFLNKHEGESITWWSDVSVSIMLRSLWNIPHHIKAEKKNRLKDKIKAYKYQKKPWTNSIAQTYDNKIELLSVT